MRRWTWSWESFIAAGAGAALFLRWANAGTKATIFWALLVGVLVAFEEKKDGLILPRRLGR